MEFTAQQIADLLQGKVEGDPSVKVNRLAKIEEGEPGSLTFLANPKYEEYIYSTKASLVIVSESFVPENPIHTNIIRVKDAYKSFALLLDTYNKISQNRVGKEEPHTIAASARIGENPYIGAFVYIGENSIIGNNVKLYPGVYIGDNVTIGDDTMIFPGVKVYSECKIGKDCRIHSGVVIGGDGFGFAPQADGTFTTIPQLGNVVLEDGVSVGANTTIDRATMGSTLIKKGVKIDNLVQIAHNVEVGANTAIAAQTGVSGSTKIGQNCLIGGQVGVAGHITIADKTIVTAQSGVTKTVRKEGQILGGTPASPNSEYLKRNALLRQLPDLLKRLES